MRILFVTIGDLTVNGRFARLKVETDGSLLYVTLGRFPRTSSSNTYSMSVTYNGETRMTVVSSSADKTVIFPYSDVVRELTLSGNQISYDGESYGSSAIFSWKGGVNDPVPEAVVDFEGIRHKRYFTFDYSFKNGNAGQMHLVAVYGNYHNIERDSWGVATHLQAKREGGSFSKTCSYDPAEYDKVEYYLYFACYESSSDGRDEYVGICEYVSPVYYISSIGSPYAPFGIEYGAAVNGVREIVWQMTEDSNFDDVEFELQRSVDGGEHETVYLGNETSYRDTDVSGSVSYRVRAVSGADASPWCGREASPYSRCNVYIGVGGVVQPARSVYIGVGGVPALTSGEVLIG